MRKLDEYKCVICGESDFGKAPYCKCEREYERERKLNIRKDMPKMPMRNETAKTDQH